MNPNADPYQDVVSEFARMGATIIRLDPRSHYEQLGDGARRPLEPGFIPIDGRPILTAISYYPNESDLPSTEFAEGRDAFQNWGRTGNVDDYREAYHRWQSFREQIPFYRRWEAPLFERLGIQSRETAWLPLIKCPLPARTAIDRDGIDVARDIHLLWDQLTLLKPEIVLVQGAVVYEILGKRLENLKFIRAHAVQKIPQQASNAMMNDQLESLTRKLRPHIEAFREQRTAGVKEADNA